MDLPPEESLKLKTSMGITSDYFVDIPPDVTTAQAQQAWVEIVRYCDGRSVEPEFYP